MGNWNSTPGAAKPPEGIKKVNDYVWEFLNPGGPPKVDIIFFHGLQLGGDYENAFWKTWTTRGDENVVWPKDWLGKEIPRARIISISIPQLDMYRLGENLVQDIILDPLNIGQCCPVILVGHCVGGIVIKQFILYAEGQGIYKEKSGKSQKDSKMHKIETFLRNFKGVFYYATPHGGSQIVNFAEPILRVSGQIGYLQLLKNHDVERERINEDFRKIRDKRKTRAFTIAESLSTTTSGFKGVVVSEGSARRDIDHWSYYTAKDANHLDVCKPNHKKSGIFTKLLAFILNEVIPEDDRLQNKQRLPSNAIHLDVFVKDIKEKLKLQKDAKVRTVGIWGMGGIGKTTAAKAVFNELIVSPTFEYSCFVPDVKLNERMSKDAANREVWKFMYYLGKSIADNQHGWSELEGKHLLLVLDDVAKRDDLQVISHIADDVGVEISCIVTCRDKQILNACEVEVYPLQLLPYEEAEKLFLSYASSKKGRALEGRLQKHVPALVKKCEGLPLALEVIGSYLKTQKDDETIWTATLKFLENADDGISDAEERLWKKLKLSYEGLPDNTKEMFLDAATFFSSMGSQDVSKWTLRDAKAAWKAIYGEGSEAIRWKNLVDLALVVDVNEGEQIRIHEELRSLGRRIAKEGQVIKEIKQIRKVWVWETKMALEFLKWTDELEIRSLSLVRREHENFNANISRSCLRGLENLRYLDVDPLFQLPIEKAKNPKRHKDKKPNERAEKNETVKMEKLVLLRSQGLCFGQFLLNPTQLSLLTVLHLVENVEHLPPSFGKLPSLKYLSFDGCKNLQTLPQTFGGLACLERLQFKDCSSLETLPDSFGDLRVLKYLSFDGCSVLQTLPKSFGRLSTLRYLSFNRCYSLCVLVNSFVELSALESFSLGE